VIDVMSQFSTCVERASIDEAYLDVTKEAEERLKSLTSSGVSVDQLANTFVEGWEVNEEETEKEDEDGEENKDDVAKKLKG